MDVPARVADAIVDGLGLAGRTLHVTRTTRVPGSHVEVLAARALDLMSTPAALTSNMRLLREGYEVPRQEWSDSRIGDGQVVHTELRQPALDHAVANGAMVVIDSVDEVDFTMMRLRESLEYRLRARAWINLYLTANSVSTFGLHYDTYDTLIVQLMGEKQWWVGDRSQEPETVVDSTGDHSLQRLVLTPGDVLVMPARALHDVSGLGVFTMHLTIGFDRVAAVPEMLAEVGALVGSDLDCPVGEDLELAKARIPERRRGSSLPYLSTHELTGPVLVRWSLRLPPVLRHADGALQVTSGLRQLIISSETADSAVIERLSGGDEWSLGDLADHVGCSLEEVARIVADLLDRDLVIARCGSPSGST